MPNCFEASVRRNINDLRTRKQGWVLRILAATAFALALFACHGNLRAAPTATAETKTANTVDVGVWMMDIHSINFVDGSFGAEFYIWWISSDPEFKPFDMLQVINGRDWKVRSVSRRTLPDGRIHTSGIVSVTAKHDWQLEYFPFDEQTLQVMIEMPLTIAELRLRPDKKGSTLSKLMNVEGFHVTGLDVREEDETYDTDFGITSGSGDRFSRLIISISLKRESSRLVVAMLIGFIVANIIALLAFLISVDNLGIRASMVGSAIFGAVGNMYSLNAALNPAIGSLLVDRFAIGTFSMIVVSLLNSIIVERLSKKGRSRLAHQVNRITFFLALTAAIVFYSVSFAVTMTGGSL